MNNFLFEGDNFPIVAPYAAVAGRIIISNNLFGVAQANANSGANVTISVGGIYTFTKANAVSTSAGLGALAYWDNTNSAVTISATSNTKIGVFAAAAANTDVTAVVRLNEAF